MTEQFIILTFTGKYCYFFLSSYLIKTLYPFFYLLSLKVHTDKLFMPSFSIKCLSPSCRSKDNISYNILTGWLSQADGPGESCNDTSLLFSIVPYTALRLHTLDIPPNPPNHIDLQRNSKRYKFYQFIQLQNKIYKEWLMKLVLFSLKKRRVRAD